VLTDGEQWKGYTKKKGQEGPQELNVQPIQAIEEVNMFKADGNVIHFAAPKGTRLPKLLPATSYQEIMRHNMTYRVNPS
jgi:hypothetical protein